MDDSETPPRGRGRPRDLGKDDAIRDAAWAVLADKGYDGLTFEAVAERAQISRTTLYRRFASKPELVAGTLYETSRALERTMQPESEPRQLLIAHCHNTIAFMGDERGRAVLNIIESASRVPELDVAVQASMRGDVQNYFDALRAVRPDASDTMVTLAFSTIVGTVIYHVVRSRHAMSDDDVEALVDAAIGMLGRG